jgi:hypothetical protein
VYDPIRNMWLGNEEELNVFENTKRPALITQLNHPSGRLEGSQDQYNIYFTFLFAHFSEWNDL